MFLNTIHREKKKQKTKNDNMKLYTEEQVKQMIEKSRETGLTADYLIATRKGIELPSDEEIDEMGKDVIIYNDTKRGWFVEGLKFMRDNIQGVNK